MTHQLNSRHFIPSMMFILIPLVLFAQTDYMILHRSAIVADGHNDAVGRMLDENLDISKRLADGNIDIPRLKEGGLDLPFFGAWIDPKYMTAGTGKDKDQSAERVHAMIDAVEKLVAANPNDIGFAKSTQEMDDVSKLPLITKALQERGWSDEAITKILGGNFLRVWKANERQGLVAY